MEKSSIEILAAEIQRLRRRVRDLEDEVALLRAQNDYLQELANTPAENIHEKDTIPAKPVPSSDRPTRPSSPKAIRLEELSAALEASDSAREEVRPHRWEKCPICQRTDEHEHEIDIVDDEWN